MKSIQEQAEAQALAFVKSYGSAYETNREKQGGIEAYEKGYVAGASPLQAEVERLREENKAILHAVAWGKGMAASLNWSDKAEYIKSQLDQLTDEQRYDIFGNYCRRCGSKDTGCQCWNDD